ncbi:hypothetical protein Tsp_00929, partial [Trichinella spiralis]|uniref:hypothetical protein n=1 Tax=Trichinella spiralis TaxID=6334 RepID=UPI0001EFB6CE
MDYATVCHSFCTCWHLNLIYCKRICSYGKAVVICYDVIVENNVTPIYQTILIQALAHLATSFAYDRSNPSLLLLNILLIICCNEWPQEKGGRKINQLSSCGTAGSRR